LKTCTLPDAAHSLVVILRTYAEFFYLLTGFVY
jgi:hypothetical protein